MAHDDTPDDELDAITKLDALLSVPPSPLNVPAPGSGFAPVLSLEPEPIPDATPENFICLRGPCKYYMQLDSAFPGGGTRGTFAKPPVQISRYCTHIVGSPIDLVDEVVHDCNCWEPLYESEVKAQNTRREDFLRRYPEFAKGHGNGGRTS